MPKSMQSGHRVTHARVCQARECIGDDGHAPDEVRPSVLPIPDVQGRMHNQTPSSGGPAEKASMAVAGAEERRGRRCRRVLLLEVEVTAMLATVAGRSEEESPDFPSQGRTIQATRRRCSKETTKNSNGLARSDA